MTETERRHDLGPGGECICPKCGTRVAHERGTRCVDECCPRLHVGPMEVSR